MDPYLLTYRVNNQESLYDLGPRFAPISIRDQMLRAGALINRALDAGKIGEDKPLLIVGAGAAGATGAMFASQNKVPTMIVERASRAFNVQLASESRFIGPNYYDWPADHWRKRKFPYAGPPMPLEWEAGSPAGVAAAWENKLLRWEARLKAADPVNPKLRILRGFELGERSISGDGRVVASFVNTRDRSDVDGPHEFAMAVSCVGHGAEILKAENGGNFVGYGFWQMDKYWENNLGLPNKIKPNVLISGSGDGGLQDFLRITVNVKSPEEMYNRLPHDARGEIERSIWSAEDRARRAYAWSAKRYDHRVLKELHDEYESVVTRLFERPFRRGVEGTLESLMRFKPGDLRIKLLHECTHFSNCYGLNRILTLLVARHMEKKYGPVLRPSTRMVSVLGAGDHVGANGCRNKASFCHGKEHDVFGTESNCPAVTAPAGKAGLRKIEGSPYNIVIIRHGTDTKSHQYPFGDAPASPARQLLPYNWAW